MGWTTTEGLASKCGALRRGLVARTKVEGGSITRYIGVETKFMDDQGSTWDEANSRRRATTDDTLRTVATAL